MDMDGWMDVPIARMVSLILVCVVEGCLCGGWKRKDACRCSSNS